MTVLLTLAVSFPQKEHNEWCKIIPFKTTRAEIQKVWGAPTAATGYVLTYDTQDARITVWYGGVKPRDNSPCKWVLAEDTVLSFVFVPRKKPPLTEVKLDMTKFKKEKALEMVDDFYYHNPTEGLTLTTRIIKGEEVLLSIERNPDQTLRQKYCRDQ